MSFCSDIAMFKTRRNHTAKNSNSISCVPQIFLNECQALARVIVFKTMRNHNQNETTKQEAKFTCEMCSSVIHCNDEITSIFFKRY